MKIRQGFVSNSSSSSFVVIDNSKNYHFPDLPEILVVDSNLGETEFGWGPEELYSVGSRINFAYLQTVYGSNENWLKMLEDVIVENTKVKEIQWNINTEWSSDGSNWGYIDHQSCASEGENTEIFDNKTILKDFLFGQDSSIVLDNDNG